MPQLKKLIQTEVSRAVKENLEDMSKFLKTEFRSLKRTMTRDMEKAFDTPGLDRKHTNLRLVAETHQSLRDSHHNLIKSLSSTQNMKTTQDGGNGGPVI